jgi:hypothetical protein
VVTPYNIPAGAANENIITEEMLQRPPLDNDLPVSTLSNEYLQEFAAKDFIQRKIAWAFLLME